MAKKFIFYDVLNVSRAADPEIICAAYTILVQRYPPGKKTDNPDEEKHLDTLNRAYETLSDPLKRVGYDAALAEDDEYAATHGNAETKSHTSSFVPRPFYFVIAALVTFNTISIITFILFPPLHNVNLHMNILPPRGSALRYP